MPRETRWTSYLSLIVTGIETETGVLGGIRETVGDTKLKAEVSAQLVCKHTQTFDLKTQESCLSCKGGKEWDQTEFFGGGFSS